jgi:hypothetical protein
MSADRTVVIHGPVTLPDIGEHVQNSARGRNEPISGKLISRAYRYRADDLLVSLLLRDNYK